MTITPPEVDKVHVLVIDDDVNIRVMLKEMLERQGYVVGAAKDGEQGLQFAQESTYGLIIVDINMPNVNGMDFLKALRTRLMSNTPVLMLTGDADVEKVKEAALNGVNGFLLKPFRAEELFKRIDSCLGRTPQAS